MKILKIILFEIIATLILTGIAWGTTVWYNSCQSEPTETATEI